MIDKTLLGVIIGGSIGFLSQFINMLIQIHTERKNRTYKEKEQAYLKALEALRIQELEMYRSKNPKSNLEKLNSLKKEQMDSQLLNAESSIILHGTDEIYKQFNKIVSTILKIKNGEISSTENVRKVVTSFHEMVKQDLNK